jgi:hypothetical protein
VFEAEARRRAFAESDALLIFLLKARDPQRFNQKQQLALSGDPNAPPVSIETQERQPGPVLILPHNGRDPIPPQMQPPPGYTPLPRTIEVEAEPVMTDETERRAEEECQQSIRVKLRR